MRLWIIYSALVLSTLCGLQPAVADRPAPIISAWEGNGSMGAVLRYLWPVLSSAGKTGRVYYRAVCPPDLRYYPLRFPQIDVQPPSEIGTDLAIVQSIFRRDHDVAVTEDKNGIVRVRIGEVPDTVLRTRISTLSFNWDTQYNVLTAISAIESAPEVQSAMRTLKVSSTARVYNYRVLHPAAGTSAPARRGFQCNGGSSPRHGGENLGEASFSTGPAPSRAHTKSILLGAFTRARGSESASAAGASGLLNAGGNAVGLDGYAGLRPTCSAARPS